MKDAEHDMAHAEHDMADADHDRHEGHSVAMFRDKFWLSLALTVPVLIWSPDIQSWFGYTAPVFPGSAQPRTRALTAKSRAVWKSHSMGQTAAIPTATSSALIGAKPPGRR